MKNITIPEPCSEDWNDMTPSEKGAFCQKCALDVYDFTNKSGDEIRDVLRENIGSRVCGHINKSQLNQLNDDFSSWQMNDKQSFQRAWVFTLFVVFGLTLFSCGQSETPVVDQFQKVGQDILMGTEPSDSLDIRTMRGQVCIIEDVEAPDTTSAGINPHEFRSFIKGKIAFEEEKPSTIKEVPAPIDIEKDFPPSYFIDGMMRVSSNYEEYLIETNEEIAENATDLTQLSGLVYPNPASNQITLRVNVPASGKGRIELFALNGQKISTIHLGRLVKGQTEFPIDLKNLEIGTYLIVIHSRELEETIRFSKI